MEETLLFVKEPWEPGHQCLGKGRAHLIEMHSGVKDEHIQNTHSEDSSDEGEQETQQVELGEKCAWTNSNVIIVSLSEVPRIHPIRLVGVIES